DARTVLTRFGRSLRDAGLPVGTDRIAEFCRAVDLLDPGEIYWAGRATLIARPEDIPLYDDAFERFFGRPIRSRAADGVRVTVSGAVAEAESIGLASPLELLRAKRFADCSEAELAALGSLIAATSFVPPRRRSRRLATASSGAPDLRRTLRRSLRTGGEPLERAWRRRQPRPRRLVLLLDVSGSMADYSRAL